MKQWSGMIYAGVNRTPPTATLRVDCGDQSGGNETSVSFTCMNKGTDLTEPASQAVGTCGPSSPQAIRLHKPGPTGDSLLPAQHAM